MSKPSAALLAQLVKNKEYQRKIVEAGGLSPVMLKLKTWQSERLAKTYQDFTESKRHRAATRFFQEQLYGPVDFTQRDADIERIYPMMQKVLSDQALNSITLAIELHVLSQELDSAMEQAISQRLTHKDDDVTPELYAACYRSLDNQPLREKQIRYLLDIGNILDEVVKNPMLYATIKIARIPAKLAGFSRLQDFVETGFDAFRKMRGAETFLAAIQERETKIMETLFRGELLPDWATPEHL